MKLETYKGWRALHCDQGRVRSAMDALIHGGGLNVLQELKNDGRSLVLLVEHDGRKMVLKSPREKNRRKWIRFTTLYRRSEAFKSLLNMEKLKQLGISSGQPFLAIERRRFGMVVDSWLLYEYVEGRGCTPKEFPLVIEMLGDMHAKGILHGDPQIRNFLTSGKKIVTIDANPRRPLWGSISKLYEYFYLQHSAPGIEAFFNLPTRSLAYSIAENLSKLYWCWRGFKRTWKHRLKTL